MLLASIPSPADPYLIDAGPIAIRWYGFLIAVGIGLAIWIARREFRRRGWDPEKVYDIALWAVPAGIIGARLYHVITDWSRFEDNLGAIIRIQEGGLGMPGVIIGGAIGAMIGARRAGLPALGVFDAIAPGLILAQAIGRWGNWFNQELFGGPSDRPWAVEISEQYRPERWADATTFVPTFLYESLWNLGVFAALMLLIIPRLWDRVRPGTIFAFYLLLYGIGRLWVESLRSDFAHEILGYRVNTWVFGIVVIAAAAWIIAALRQRRPAA